MQHRRTAALVGVALLALAACGPGPDDAASPVVEDQPVDTAAPAVADVSDADSADATPPATDTVEPSGAESAVATDAPADSTNDEPAADAGTEPPSTEPVATQAPEPAEPVVGGRQLAADLQPASQFDGNPFPNLVVDDIGKDAKANVANILPSDRPVLLWAWAPH